MIRYLSDIMPVQVRFYLSGSLEPPGHCLTITMLASPNLAHNLAAQLIRFDAVSTDKGVGTSY